MRSTLLHSRPNRLQSYCADVCIFVDLDLKFDVLRLSLVLWHRLLACLRDTDIGLRECAHVEAKLGICTGLLHATLYSGRTFPSGMQLPLQEAAGRCAAHADRREPEQISAGASVIDVMNLWSMQLLSGFTSRMKLRARYLTSQMLSHCRRSSARIACNFLQP